MGFLAAVQRGEFDRAAEYLDTRAQGRALVELAEQLAYIIDNSQLGRVSDVPEGSGAPGVRPGFERLGVIPKLEGTLDLELVRVRRKGEEPVWLFSARTLAGIPEAHEYLSARAINRFLPAFLVQPVWLGVPLWKYLALVAAFVLSYALTLLLRPRLARLLGRWIPEQPEPENQRMAVRIATPAGVLVALLVTEIVVIACSLPFLARELWNSILSKVGVLAGAWLILAIVRAGAAAYRWRIERTKETQITAVVRLAERSIQILCLFFAILIVLRLAGYDVTGMLAGLGLGGVALAFAAQKSLENLFGGVSVILDRTIRVGDDCVIAGRNATVVDIGMRSTRFRTLERSILTVPNGQLAAMTLDNLSMRDHIWFRHVLNVRLAEGFGQLEPLLDALRTLLAREPMVDNARRRVRLIRVDAQGAEIEMFCDIRTRSYAEFLEVQEALLLGCLKILAAHGAALAPPPHSIVLTNPAPPAGAGSPPPA